MLSGQRWPDCLNAVGFLAAKCIQSNHFGKGHNFSRPELSQHILFQPFEPIKAGDRTFLGRLRAVRKLPYSPSPALKSSRTKANICFQIGGFWSQLHVRAPLWRLEFWPFWVIRVFKMGPPKLLPSPWIPMLCSSPGSASAPSLMEIAGFWGGMRRFALPMSW